jgi:hypothetical protein
MGSSKGGPIMETKTCKRCGETKTVDLFYVIKSGKRAGMLHTYCRKCLSAQTMSYQKKDPEKYREIQRRYWADNPSRSIRAHMRRYGSDENWYFAKLEEQNGACAICQKQEWRSGTRLDGKPHRLSADHDHETGALRGLLCNSCNTKVATLEMDHWLENARAYLAKYQP